MSAPDRTARAASTFCQIVHGIAPDQLSSPTPCREYDVHGLLNHLLFWGPSLVGAGHKESVPPPAADERSVDLIGSDWRAALDAHVDRTVDAWSRADAWEGLTSLGGPDQMPAPLVGGMVIGELVVHGWDLARATGQTPAWDDDLLAFLHGEVAATAGYGREVGVYGDEVDIGDDASVLHRILALTGREPAWAADQTSTSKRAR